jgi:hypothetical protein
MAFVVEKERRLPLSDIYRGEATKAVFNFRWPNAPGVGEASLIEAAINGASIATSLRNAYLFYEIARDHTTFPDSWRVIIWVAEGPEEERSGQFPEIGLIPLIAFVAIAAALSGLVFGATVTYNISRGNWSGLFGIPPALIALGAAVGAFVLLRALTIR